MLLYRVAKSQYIEDMSGTGGLYASGRWHSKGTRILYFSEHISLAKLEVLANSLIVPKNMSLMTVRLPEKFSIKKIDQQELPTSWDGYPYLAALQGITSRWIKENTSLVLQVPSAQAEHEYNMLINPLHKEAGKIEIVSVEPIKFDQRLKF